MGLTNDQTGLRTAILFTPAVNFLQPVDHFLGLMSRVEEKDSTTTELTPAEIVSLTGAVFVLRPPEAVEYMP